ncbi:hypothetical protein POTOM_054305 [Populus tomentosa]|uniref:DJ-1/PfpI domain-containing protein n=1 Tax=Populus tomentosa TaxID=118781 RepID=A0A8X7Y2T4_POPTO|nr:hypothetical protein POTOM_054305 [Populus tomentosa]
MGKSVLLLCGDYMEDHEAMVPFQALQAYGIAVDAACPDKKAGDICRTAIHDSAGYQTYTESRGHNFTLNATFDEVDFDKYDGLVIPGGRAPEYLAMNESVLDCVRKFSDSGRPIASVCHGQLILAAANSVKGRKCTAYPAVKPVLIDAGAHWVEPETMKACVVDGNIITGATYEGHPEFIQLFVRALGGKITGSDKKILFLCGDFMEDYEVTVPFQSLEALGCHVDAVCPKKKGGDTCPTAVHDFEGDQTYSEKPGHSFTLTASFEGLDASNYDALVIPGGRAPEYLALDETVIALVKEFMHSKKPVASICHGQQILAAAGVLKGRKCTAYPAVKLNVVLGGATWLEPDPIDRCYTDENLVTGAAWPGHPQFVSQLMALLGIRQWLIASHRRKFYCYVGISWKIMRWVAFIFIFLILELFSPLKSLNDWVYYVLQAMVPFQALQAYGIAVDAVCPGKKAGDCCRTAIQDSGAYHGYQWQWWRSDSDGSRSSSDDLDGDSACGGNDSDIDFTFTEKRGHNFSLNANFDEVDFSKYDGLLLPGGRAPEYLAINESVLDCVRKFSDSGKPIGSICHGQLILAAAGSVRGRKCTALHALGPVLIDAGAHWIEPKTRMDCVADGNIITGVIYRAHPEYIRLFVRALGGKVTGSDKRILFLCGDFMEDYEVTVPFQSLQALGCHVDAVSPKKKAGDICPTAVHDFEGDQTYSEKPGHNFILTASYEGLDASSYDALVIPGGRAPEYLALDETVIALVKEFMQSRKPVASICHGQQILAAAGVLKGRRCTAYPTVKLNVVLGGATWLEPDPIDRCYTDENLVTGAAWPGHPEFVSQLMALLGVIEDNIPFESLQDLRCHVDAVLPE